MRIVQVSDTHLSVAHGHFARNAELTAACLKELSPDLIVHTGDVSMDGAGDVNDLDLSARWSAELPAEMLAVPGNHDVGDHSLIRPDQPVTTERLAAWRRIVGADRWFRDIGDWRLVGINSMLLGTGHRDEAEQFEWLAAALQTSRPVALFMHKPMCIDSLAEGPRGYWTVTPQPRARLRQLLQSADVRLIASGHLHIQRLAQIEGVAHVWGPAASFVVGSSQEELGGERRLGLVEHTFTADAVRSRFLRPEGLEDLLIDPVQHVIYPPYQNAAS